MLLDTNAISEAAKNKQGEGKNLIRLMTTENIFQYTRFSKLGNGLMFTKSS
jgi:hypothetical protein